MEAITTTPPAAAEDYMTVAETALVSGYSKDTVRRHVGSMDVRTRKLGRSLRIHRADFMAAIEAGSTTGVGHVGDTSRLGNQAGTTRLDRRKVHMFLDALNEFDVMGVSA